MSSPLASSPAEQGALSASQLHLLATLCSDLAGAPGLPTLVARLAQGFVRLLSFDQLALAMRAPDGRTWALIRPRLAAVTEPGWLEVADPDSALEEAMVQGQPVRRSSGGSYLLPPGLEAAAPIRDLSLFPYALCLPIHGPTGTIGAVGLFSGSTPYSMGDLHLLSVLVPLIESTAHQLLLHEELSRAQRAAQETERLRGELNHLLRSDLRSPLTVLENGLDFLQSALLPNEAAEAREHVEELRLVSATLVEMVDNHADLTRLEAGWLTIQPQAVRLEPWLKELAGRKAAAAKLSEVHVVSRCEPADAVGTFDPALMARVVETLLVNALRHTPRRGQVALVARAVGATLTLAIADTGVPVPPDQREIIFARPMLRDEESEKHSSRAYGLPFCKTVIELHGGRVTVEGPPAGGNLFRIVLGP
jgi:K+-sensing histidine kinase KdpD